MTLLLPSLRSPPIVSLFLVLVLMLSPSLTFSDGSAAIVLREACKRASREDPNVAYEFCLSSLGPGSDRATTIHDLVLISLDLSVSNTTRIRSRIKMLLKGGEFDKDPYAKSCLRDCLELYSDARSTLRGVMKDLEGKDYEKAIVDLSAAMDAPITCEDGFGEKEGEVSQLTAENDVFFRLSALCLALVTMLR